MLAQEVAAKYGDRVRFVSENFGESKLAERFGIKRYPAIFVDDVLVAKPNDFGFFGEGEKAGRYTPWKNAENHQKFKDDLVRMVDLILKDKKAEAVLAAGPQTATEELHAIPKFSVTDLDGKPLSQAEVAGRVVLVEFWATWCPPCRTTLEWLGGLRKQYGDNVAVIAFAVESPEPDIRKLTASMSKDLHWVIATPAVAGAFGDVVAVPTMYIFDQQGKTAGQWYGAPPERHEQAEKILKRLLAR
ncbi:MAG: TlpA disulfide reductase family protein [Bryobacteraceae bacterium]